MQIKLAQLMAARNSIRGKHDTEIYSLGSECMLAMTVFVDILRAHTRENPSYQKTVELDAFFDELLANDGEESDCHNKRSPEWYVRRLELLSDSMRSCRFSKAMEVYGEACMRALVRAKHGTQGNNVDITEAWMYIGLIRMTLVDPPVVDPAARFLVDEDMLNMQEAVAERGHWQPYQI